MTTEQHKQLAAKQAIPYIQDGMTIGLGTGSTSNYFIQYLAEHVRKKNLKIQTLASSLASEKLAIQLNLPLCSHCPDKLDVTVDGADEVDANLNIIKGGGGALLREKILAYSSKKWIIIIDKTKKVQQLGHFKIPLEVLPFSWELTQKRLEDLSLKTSLRKKGNKAITTDNGNYLLDLHFSDSIKKPQTLDNQLRMVPGILETGLFINTFNPILIVG